MNPKKIDLNPLAINILKLQRYNFNYFTLEEVVFFEYLIVKGQSFGFKQFYHSTATIAKETGIKRTRLATVIERFIKEGFIQVEVKGMPKVKHFTVNFEAIYASVYKVYQHVDYNQPNAEIIKVLVAFYQPLVDKYLQKNTNKHIKEETLKETLVTDNGQAKACEAIDILLKKLARKYRLEPEKTTYNPDALKHLLSLYKEEDILDSLDNYFDWGRKREKTVTGFIQSMIDSYISKEEIKRTDAGDFLSELNNIFNARRAFIKNGKKYSNTKLAINKTIIGKMVEVLKEKEEVEIQNAFTAYVDAILEKEESPKRILNYFLTQKNGEYPIIDTYLDYFNCNYSITN